MHSTTASGNHPARSHIQFTPTGLSVLCVSLVAVSAGLGRWSAGSGSPQASAPPAAQQPSAVEKPMAGDGSPWGELMVQNINIEQPDEYVSFEVTTNRETRWVFKGMGERRVRELLEECGMDTGSIDTCLKPDRVENGAGVLSVKPADEVVMGLAQSVRNQLYTRLAQWPENRYMANPYHFAPTKLATLLEAGGISAPVRDQVNRLVYERAGHSYFSDPEIVLRGMRDAGERQRLMRVLTSQQAVLARLKVDETSNVEALMGYWGNMPGVCAKDLRPLLESLRREPGGGSISLLYLLPRFARERLYTFPYPGQSADKASDCHWTALNFFNETPDDRLRDNAFASKYIQDRFYQIGRPSRCGDIVFITNPAGEVIHSAVHIADDICFTKNGVNFAQPWILMRLDDLSDVYTSDGEPKMLFYRRKEA